MESWRHSQLDAFRPYRVVIEGAVEVKRIKPVSTVFGMSWNRAGHVTGHHDRLHAKRTNRIFQFLDRFLRRMHRDACGGRHTIGEFAKNPCMVEVKGAAGGPAHFLVFGMRRAESQ